MSHINIITQMPPKKASPAPAPPPPKNTFFKPGFRKAAVILPAPTAFPRQQFAPRRSFLYNKDTGDAYAEWMGNEAVCLETGEVLFESKGSVDYGSSSSGGFSPAKFDFTPPKQRHPKDPSITTQDLLDADIITLEDFKNGRSALSVEAHERFKKK